MQHLWTKPLSQIILCFSSLCEKLQLRNVDLAPIAPKLPPMDCLNCDEKCYCVGECSFCSKDFDCAGECQRFLCFLTPFTLSNFFQTFCVFCCFYGTFLFIKLWPKINLRPLSFVIICAKRSYFGNSESGRENSICSMIYDRNEEFN